MDHLNGQQTVELHCGPATGTSCRLVVLIGNQKRLRAAIEEAEETGEPLPIAERAWSSTGR